MTTLQIHMPYLVNVSTKGIAGGSKIPKICPRGNGWPHMYFLDVWYTLCVMLCFSSHNNILSYDLFSKVIKKQDFIS